MDRRQAIVPLGSLIPTLHLDLARLFANEFGTTDPRVHAVLRRELPKPETADGLIDKREPIVTQFVMEAIS